MFLLSIQSLVDHVIAVNFLFDNLLMPLELIYHLLERFWKEGVLVGMHPSKFSFIVLIRFELKLVHLVLQLLEV